MFSVGASVHLLCWEQLYRSVEQKVFQQIKHRFFFLFFSFVPKAIFLEWILLTCWYTGSINEAICSSGTFWTNWWQHLLLTAVGSYGTVQCLEFFCAPTPTVPFLSTFLVPQHCELLLFLEFGTRIAPNCVLYCTAGFSGLLLLVRNAKWRCQCSLRKRKWSCQRRKVNPTGSKRK